MKTIMSRGGGNDFGVKLRKKGEKKTKKGKGGKKKEK